MHHIQSPRPDTDETIEDEIKRKGKIAPRIVPEDVEKVIASTHYFTARNGVFGAGEPGSLVHSEHPALGLLTFCVLILRNGFTVTGESACASPENFDAEIGRRVARQNAVQKIWPLLGYQLRGMLAAQAEREAVLAGRPLPHHPV